MTQKSSATPVKVLAVEDSATQAAALSVLLEQEGYDVVLAGSGEKALIAIRDERIDVVLSDIVMPGMDGYELCKRIKSERPEIPVILLTSLNDPLAIVRGLESGADHYVTKPYDPEQLIARVEHVMRRAAEGTQFTPRPVDVNILGTAFTISASKEQILELLVSSYGDLVRTSEAVSEAAQRARFLADAGVLLSASLDERQIFDDLARLSTPYLADVCIVDLVSTTGEVRRADLAVSDSAPPEIAELIRRTNPRDSVRHFEAAETKSTPAPVAGALRDILALPQAESGDTASALHDASAIVAPLMGHAGLFGALTFVSMRSYTREDLVLATDVALRAAIALENARLYREATQATRARDDVLAVVSHDLRNPLNAVQMSASFLLEMLETPGAVPPFDQQLRTINRAVKRANRLIGDLLDVSRIDAGTLAVERSPWDASQVLSDAVEDQRGLATEKHLTIGEKWNGPALRIPLDKERIGQVFSNLIGNAIKFTPAGGRIAVEGRQNGEMAEFVVSDTGPGISAEHLPHLFDRFWQANRATRTGAGLGLSIARGIIVAHGGTLCATSEVGNGTQFTFTIPLAYSAQERAQ